MAIIGRTVVRPVVIVAVVAMLALGGCRLVSSGSGIDWHACGPDDGVASATIPGSVAGRVSCGRLSVPLDPRDPGLGTVSLAVARLGAAGPKAGTLVINPGGPGGSGVGHLVDSSASLAESALADTHDIVSFDPRGVGASRPVIGCRTDAERDTERAMDLGDRSAAGIARVERYQATVALECRERVGPDVLARVGTDFVAGDLDRIRTALGEDAIDFLGYSYGTRLGLEYAARYPSRLGALVLDGVVDPVADPIDASIEQHRGFQQAFDAFAADCVRRPGCSLGDRADGTVARYRAILAPLLADPAPAGGRTLSAGDAETATVASLYQRSGWGGLRAALVALAAGDGTEMMRLADSFEGRDDDGRYDPTQDAFTAITCADDPRVPDRARYDELDRRARGAAPFRDDGRGSGRGPLGICEFWVPAVHAGGGMPDDGVPGAGAPRALVVASTADPATPYPTAMAVARRIGAAVISVDRPGHTSVFRGDECVDGAVTRYLSDLTVPHTTLGC
ncbi:alpha/beta hydrolase [Gordonia hankookensis]|uniref:Alpha/beta fold hydrolase n=1 Tax=Gordonia hankookensis TaxID=589403 RepID=A0ABR7W8Q4_9ACTN|nr:alpha/beta hydrolase [Gordonia hankookensis]MBD1318182.1 alpha/beta fold hydrolase [Gordonia hankookensis]